MKICVINDHFSMSSGGQHRIQNLSKGFEALGHEVLYVCPYGISTEVSDLFIEKTQSYQSLIYPKYISPYFSDFFKIFKKTVAYHIKCDFSVVELPNTMMKSLNALYGKVEGIPVTFDFGGLWASSFDKGKVYGAESRWLRTVRPFAQLYEDILAMLSSRLPDLITVPTTGMKVLLEKFLGRKMVHIVYHPVDTKVVFDPSDPRINQTIRLPKQFKNKRIIMMGIKDNPQFVPFMERLISDYELSDVVFILLGRVNKVAASCKNSKLTQHLWFTGPVPNTQVYAYLKLVTFAIALSLPEVSKVYYYPDNISKIAEYASMGKATLTNTLGASDYILDGKTGYITTNLDVLARRVAYLIDNPEKAKQMGEMARKFACEKFDMRIAASKYLDLIRGALNDASK